MSHNSLVQRAMSNEWLAEQGVPSLEKLWVSIRYPDGPKRVKSRLQVACWNRRATDPYGRWCGGRELEPPAYPIGLLILSPELANAR